MLRDTLDRIQAFPNAADYPVIRSLPPAEVVNGLRVQLDAFWRGQWPFNEKLVDDNPLAWWTSFQFHPHARVLAVSAVTTIFRSS